MLATRICLRVFFITITFLALFLSNAGCRESGVYESTSAQSVIGSTLTGLGSQTSGKGDRPRLVLVGPSEMFQEACVAFTVTRAYHSPSASNNSATSDLFLASSSDGIFSQDPACSQATKEVAITKGTDSAVFYFKTFVLGAQTLSVDDKGGRLLGTSLNLTVIPKNFPPQASDASLIVPMDYPVPGRLIATDRNNDPLTFSIVQNGTYGRLELTDPRSGEFVYYPNSLGPVTDIITFKANDGELDSNIAEVAVDITYDPLIVDYAHVNDFVEFVNDVVLPPGKNWYSIIYNNTVIYNNPVTSYNVFQDGILKGAGDYYVVSSEMGLRQSFCYITTDWSTVNRTIPAGSSMPIRIMQIQSGYSSLLPDRDLPNGYVIGNVKMRGVSCYNGTEDPLKGYRARMSDFRKSLSGVVRIRKSFEYAYVQPTSDIALKDFLRTADIFEVYSDLVLPATQVPAGETTAFYIFQGGKLVEMGGLNELASNIQSRLDAKEAFCGLEVEPLAAKAGKILQVGTVASVYSVNSLSDSVEIIPASYSFLNSGGRGLDWAKQVLKGIKCFNGTKISASETTLEDFYSSFGNLIHISKVTPTQKYTYYPPSRYSRAVLFYF